MKPPCMIVVQHILPAIRSAVARELIEVHGLNRSKVAELMGLTPAAITQYLNSLRGDNVELLMGSEQIRGLVSELAQVLVCGAASPDVVVLRMCRICGILRSQKIICKLHIEEYPSLKGVEACACGFGLVE